MTKLHHSTEQARAHFEGRKAEGGYRSDDKTFECDPDPVNDFARGLEVTCGVEHKLFRPRSHVFSCETMAEILSVLKPFAEWADIAERERCGLGGDEEFRAARSLYLKLGGKL